MWLLFKSSLCKCKRYVMPYSREYEYVCYEDPFRSWTLHAFARESCWEAGALRMSTGLGEFWLVHGPEVAVWTSTGTKNWISGVHLNPSP